MTSKPERSSGPESQACDGADAPAPPSQHPEFLSLLSAPRAEPRWPLEPMLVATCVDARHPTLHGRVRVRWAEGSEEVEPQQRWVPTLHGLAIRAGDRVLLSRVSGLPEPIVVGVIDGFEPRPAPSHSIGATLEFQPEEVLTIVEHGGQPLVRISQGAGGPIVHLLQADTQLELPGRLSITAAELELKAVRGNVQIEASDAVVVNAETVRLN